MFPDRIAQLIFVGKLYLFMKHYCPICRSADIQYLFSTEVPTLQNRVYGTRDEAINAVRGTVNLSHCSNCNFSFNADFDEKVIVYDEKYDNAVPSKLFTSYYRTICRYLFEKYELNDGIVYDIGCGKGTFLKMLCAEYPALKGIGIDPSYEGDLQPMDNLTFIRDFFKAEHVTAAPALILSRHVFEHIEFPKDFLEIIREPISTYPDVPFFIEVPDFTWIVANKTFWDICYEHCNYFSQKSIAAMFDRSRSVLHTITKSFGDQYLWVEGVFNASGTQMRQLQFPSIEKQDIQEFVDSISDARTEVRDHILQYKQRGYKTIVWGMATKGVIFTNIIDKDRRLIDYCIDINTEKQDKYAPLSAHQILNPDILTSIAGAYCLIIVMNTNYITEIRASIAAYSSLVHFIDAHGTAL